MSAVVHKLKDAGMTRLWPQANDRYVLLHALAKLSAASNSALASFCSMQRITESLEHSFMQSGCKDMNDSK